MVYIFNNNITIFKIFCWFFVWINAIFRNTIKEFFRIFYLAVNSRDVICTSLWIIKYLYNRKGNNKTVILLNLQLIQSELISGLNHFTIIIFFKFLNYFHIFIIYLLKKQYNNYNYNHSSPTHQNCFFLKMF